MPGADDHHREAPAPTQVRLRIVSKTCRAELLPVCAPSTVEHAERHHEFCRACLIESLEDNRFEGSQRQLDNPFARHASARSQTLKQPQRRVVVDIACPYLPFAAEMLRVEVVNLESVASRETDHPR